VHRDSSRLLAEIGPSGARKSAWRWCIVKALRQQADAVFWSAGERLHQAARGVSLSRSAATAGSIGYAWRSNDHAGSLLHAHPPPHFMQLERVPVPTNIACGRQLQAMELRI